MTYTISRNGTPWLKAQTRKAALMVLENQRRNSNGLPVSFYGTGTRCTLKIGNGVYVMEKTNA